ncbi:NAD(P)/FAD-dependent oxidoreductase [Mycobacteroides abscessus]|uniref:NAD(P)/FAD-dependent oxidoreductase n=1 Tax=Mycobacteroides abscessus TaxID=36809 RepID=UPI0005E5120B|nr:FAD-binding oxidoreductase [Mycobacteroides abscessus]CPS17352.1 Putative oxidoreductase [Mycobacteroides abscessus]CPS50083.1 Putative oxidoreductase [Mycobacteroides abscessus]CPS51281.1 Putative oxidoreductase [Mycobacteroides abscessus]CPT29451.1 Putative oxidoreductase [Mycobacteroides abscessus]CPT37009.1 Putative oxidoreductase [Mycobacteroides abscessus]
MNGTEIGHLAETAPIWWPGSPESAAPITDGRHDVDVLVIGAGLAGLAAAYFVTELRPELSVAVLEAKHVGAGATGRSTGIVSPGLSMPMVAFRRKYGDDAAIASFDATFHGVGLLRDLVAKENIDCDARDEPHTLVALTDRSLARMVTHLENLAELGREVPWLSSQEVVQWAGAGYKAGFAYRDAMVVDPYRLVTGMADILRRRGAPVYEHSPVISIEADATGVCVSTARAQVRARHAFLATDGYSGTLNPLKSSVIPLRTHLLATAPLTEGQLAELGWSGRGAIIDQRTFFNYYRMSADKRVVFGGGPAFVPSRIPSRDIKRSRVIQQRVRRELTERFPVLADVEIDAAWSGITASSFDRNPVVGPVPGMDGLWFAGSWCGHGFSTSVDTGWRFAKTLVGEPLPANIPWFRSGAQRVPTTLLRNVATGAYLKALDAADALDAKTSNPPQVARPTVGRQTSTGTTTLAEADK